MIHSTFTLRTMSTKLGALLAIALVAVSLSPTFASAQESIEDVPMDREHVEEVRDNTSSPTSVTGPRSGDQPILMQAIAPSSLSCSAGLWCQDLTVTNANFDAACVLTVSIANIGTVTAIANQLVVLNSQDVASGDTAEWHMSNLAPQQTGTLDFGVVQASQSTLRVTVDLLNFQNESNEANNEFVASVPAGCVAAPPVCLTHMVLGQSSNVYEASVIDGTTGPPLQLDTTGIGNVNSITYDDDGTLWAINRQNFSPYDTAVTSYDPSGAIISTFAFTNDLRFWSLGWNPQTGRLIAEHLDSIVEISPTTGAMTVVATAPGSYNQEDLAWFDGDIYTLVGRDGWPQGEMIDLWRIEPSGTATMLGGAPDRSGLAVAENAAGIENLFVVDLDGNVSQLGGGTSVTLDVPSYVLDSASRPCPAS